MAPTSGRTSPEEIHLPPDVKGDGKEAVDMRKRWDEAARNKRRHTFVKDRWGWISSDMRWRQKSKQGMERLFKNCPAWKWEIRALRKTAGGARQESRGCRGG